MTSLLLYRRGSLMTGGAPKWRTIKTVFSLPESDDLEGGIFQLNWYMRLWRFASEHLLLPETKHLEILVDILPSSSNQYLIDI